MAPNSSCHHLLWATEHFSKFEVFVLVITAHSCRQTQLGTNRGHVGARCCQQKADQSKKGFVNMGLFYFSLFTDSVDGFLNFYHWCSFAFTWRKIQVNQNAS